MSKLLRVVFGVLIVSGLGAYDYVQVTRAQAAASALGVEAPAGYLASLRERLMHAAAKTEAVTLADHLLDAPRGWTRASYEPSDGEALVGQPMQAAEVRSTTNDLLHRLRLTAPGTGRMAETYRNGGTLVVISLSLGAPAPADDVVRADYAMVRGLPMALLGQRDVDAATGLVAEAPYRRLLASPGGQAELMVITNADDQALVDVLETVDLPGLNTRLPSPAAGVSPEKPVYAGIAVAKDPLPVAEAEEPDAKEIVAEADAPKAPCVRRGTVLTCE